jgi:membrane-associated protease RseP (regulator of RpoE activity)
MTHYFLTAVTLFLAIFLVAAPLIFHEMGHWAALRRFGVPVTQYWVGLGPAIFEWKAVRIGMLPIGGAVVPDKDKYATLSGRQKLVVALAGPFASLLYGAIAWCTWLLNKNLDFSSVFLNIAYLNLVLAGVNLLPIPPLDGFQAWVAWRETRGAALSEQTVLLAQKTGSGLVYGIGFLALGFVFFK